MKILVAGGRDFTNKVFLKSMLNALRTSNEFDPIELVITGGARGADTMAHNWAVEKGIPTQVVNADWNTYGKKAGWIRNNQMADLEPDLVILFSGGIGTEMMFGIAKSRELDIWDLRDKEPDEGWGGVLPREIVRV